MKLQISKQIAYLLPRKVVYFCAIRIWAHGTTGKYSCDNAAQSTIADMIARWE